MDDGRLSVLVKNRISLNKEMLFSLNLKMCFSSS